jgi:hypothetical protein
VNWLFDVSLVCAFVNIVGFAFSVRRAWRRWRIEGEALDRYGHVFGLERRKGESRRAYRARLTEYLKFEQSPEEISSSRPRRSRQGARG